MITIESIALKAATEIMALPPAGELLGGAVQLKAKTQIIVRNHIEDALDKAQQAKADELVALHRHIRHLRAIIYPPKMSDSAAWRPVPAKHLSAIQLLIDPAPVVVGEKTMVFVNPHAAEALTAISAEVRAMMAEPLPEQPAFGDNASIDTPAVSTAPAQEPVGYVSVSALAALAEYTAHKMPNSIRLYNEVQKGLVEVPVFAAPLPAVAPSGDVERCELCNYDHGHSIGCENNPVDQALKRAAITVTKE